MSLVHSSILPDFISSYRKFHSCETSLLRMTEEWRLMRDDGQLVGIVSMDLSKAFVVQSLNSPFFPPPVGAEPGRAKGESRITCMRMLRTNQSKITRVLATLLASMCRAMPFSARARKKKTHFL